MIVPEFDQEEMCHTHTFDSVPQTFPGDVRVGAPPFREELTNPRPLGFGAFNPFYIPIYWCEDA